MKSIDKEIAPNGWKYSMESETGHADVVIEVDAEVGGHGCLFGMKLPEFSVEGGSHGGPKSRPNMDEVMHVLNRIFKDFNVDMRVTSGRITEV